MIRIGQGIDAHAFQPGGRLVLGGVEIPHDAGLAAHSDGDVVLHALCDALLGAALLGLLLLIVGAAVAFMMFGGPGEDPQASTASGTAGSDEPAAVTDVADELEEEGKLGKG
mgnify:CR=1 FL=1